MKPEPSFTSEEMQVDNLAPESEVDSNNAEESLQEVTERLEKVEKEEEDKENPEVGETSKKLKVCDTQSNKLAAFKFNKV